MSFFLSDAIAVIDAPSETHSYSLAVMLLIFGILLYVMVIRPQQKRVKMHKELMNSISQGDEVLTTGGLIGRVVKVMNTGYIFISLNENNEVIIKRDFVSAILPKGTIKALS